MLLSILSNGIKLFSDDFWRGVGAAIGIVPLHHVPITYTNKYDVLKQIEAAGGFGFVSTRRPDNISLFQKLVDGATRSPFAHSQLLIGEDIAKEVRKRYPEVMRAKPSPRWKGRRSYEPSVIIEGINRDALNHEIVESRLLVSVSSLLDTLKQGEQAVVFINPNWTREDKIRMAREAYSWVGEPYDVFEIGNWAVPLIPHSKSLKVCSSLVCRCLSVVDDDILVWCRLHGIDPERISPGALFAYGSDTGCIPYCFRCTYTDVMGAWRK